MNALFSFVTSLTLSEQQQWLWSCVTKATDAANGGVRVRVWPCVWWPDQRLWTASRPLGPKNNNHVTNNLTWHWSATGGALEKKERTDEYLNNALLKTASFLILYPLTCIKSKTKKTGSQQPVATFPRARVELSASSTSWAISLLNCCTSWHSLARAWCRSSSATRSPWKKGNHKIL